ncbi:MAG: hypothetical protein HYY25_03135 [Candidatus Wallbacteria bacterium]|nr:hypothetical protein [Candidatus Wallbacteria bacterium]
MLAALVMGGLMVYFGFTMQGFVQQEDTMTGSRDAQLILSWLRADLTAADGYDASGTATTGTTFPKSEVHLVQTLGSDRLAFYIHTRAQEPIVRPGDDPVLDAMTPEARTGSWVRLLGLTTDDPIFGYLSPGTAANDFLRVMNYAMNAASWVHPREPDAPRFLNVNVRSGSLTAPASYRFHPVLKRLERSGPNGVTLLGRDDVDYFAVSPFFELFVDPAQPGGPPELVRVWYEIALRMRAQADGAKIAKRTLDFSTRVTPGHLNAAIKSRWGR